MKENCINCKHSCFTYLLEDYDLIGSDFTVCGNKKSVNHNQVMNESNNCKLFEKKINIKHI